MKKKLLTLALAAVMTLPAISSFADNITAFDDVPDGAAYVEAVKYCSNNGLMQGTSETEFSPNENTTIGMLVTILHRNEGMPSASASAGFTDVESGSWYYDAVNWAAQNGIVSGYDNEHFGPEDTLTREQIITILWRTDGSAASNTSVTYSDSAAISDYAKTAIAWAAENDIIDMSAGELAPQGDINRAEMATLLYRYLYTPEPTALPTTEPASAPQNPAAENTLSIGFGYEGEKFTMYLEDNETTQMLLAALGSETMNLPIYHYDDYENWELMMYYQIPSRYNIPMSPETVTSEKAGEVFLTEDNEILLFYHDAQIEGNYTRIGHIEATPEFVAAIEENPVLEGWGNKIVTISPD